MRNAFEDREAVDTRPKVPQLQEADIETANPNPAILPIMNNKQQIQVAHHDNWLASFEQQQRAASEQHQRALQAKRQCDDEAFRKICKEMDDFWRSPTGIACEAMFLLVPIMPLLTIAAIVLIMLNAATPHP
jgi:hypothetical protein